MQGSKLYVGNLNYAVTNEQIDELFSAHGTVKSVNIIESKGFGFVEMSSPEEAEQAKEALHDTDFMGRALKIDEARPQKKKPHPSGGGGYGGSGGGYKQGGGGGGGGGYKQGGGGGGYKQGGGGRSGGGSKSGGGSRGSSGGGSSRY